MSQDRRISSLLSLLQPVLSADTMREADRITINELGIPGFTLMESAGRAAAEMMERRYGSLRHKTVACFCGKGNNGGDGFVVARVLHARGVRLRVFTLGARNEMSEDAARNLAVLERIAAEVPDGTLEITPFNDPQQLDAVRSVDVIVDALLGTGLTNALREPIVTLVDWMNEQSQPVVALDLPTGLHTDLGTVLGSAVRADMTVTMAALKSGLLINEGRVHAGTTRVAEIGIPQFILDRLIDSDVQKRVFQITDRAVRRWLPRRSYNAHKYSVGLALVVGGSPGLTGAPVMASTAAARIGAGAVVCACQQQVQPLLAMKMTEIMTLALPESTQGGIDAEPARQALAERLDKARALLVGCGLGKHPDTQQFVRTLLESVEIPTVIDADGLNALVGATDLISNHSNGKWILTPHAGEFRRLAGDKVDLIDRIAVARQFARQWNCVLVLKGMPSVVSGPDGSVLIGSEFNPALATAGTGDVLAGLCVGLLAQGLDPLQAAATAVHLGGVSAMRYASRRFLNTMIATDLLEELPGVLQERFS